MRLNGVKDVPGNPGRSHQASELGIDGDISGPPSYVGSRMTNDVRLGSAIGYVPAVEWRLRASAFKGRSP